MWKLGFCSLCLKLSDSNLLTTYCKLHPSLLAMYGGKLKETSHECRIFIHFHQVFTNLFIQTSTYKPQMQNFILIVVNTDQLIKYNLAM